MKNMKKIFTGVAIAVALSTSPSVFADKFSAFDGVPSEIAPQNDLDTVSGQATATKVSTNSGDAQQKAAQSLAQSLWNAAKKGVAIINKLRGYK